MKKVLLILCMVLYIFVGTSLAQFFKEENFSKASSNNQPSLFGRVITNNAPFLKTSTKIEDHTNVYFLLEESYFVKVLAEIENEYYYVEYQDLKGYVKQNHIALVNENILHPYLENITFNISKECFLQKEPKNLEENQIVKLSKNQTITYYGKIFSEEISPNSGNVWFFCSQKTSEGTVFGYVHSSLTNNLSPIVPNEEVTTNFTSTNSNQLSVLSLNLKTQSIIITVISLPVFLLLFIFLKGFKKV
ncbi:MAG: hypothetical protein ACI4TI_02625 [Christensenellales bacterium]